MPQVTSHQPGTPSWVDLGSPAPDESEAFYGPLFGWEFTEPGPVEETGGYRMATLEGKSVAGLGAQQNPGPPYWTTYVSVDDADLAAKKVEEAGGQVLVPAMDVMTAGRMAVFTDSGGAPFSVWQPGEHIGAEIVNEPGTLVWNELTTREVATSKAFYQAVFGWHPNEMDMGEHGTYVEWQLDGRGIGGMQPMEGDMWPASLPNHWMTYFAVDDTDATAEQAQQLGGKVSVPPTDIPPGRFAVLNDPHGAVFSVIKMSPPA